MSCGDHLKDKESFIECLKREIKAELNLEIEVINPIINKIKEEIPFIINSKQINNQKIIIIEYLCKAKNFETIKINKNELIEYTLFSKEEITNYKFNSTLNEILEKIFAFIEIHNNLT